MIINTEKLAKIIELIEKTSDYDSAGDNENFDIEDYSGGNTRDAYNIGHRDGEINFARELKQILE